MRQRIIDLLIYYLLKLKRTKKHSHGFEEFNRKFKKLNWLSRISNEQPTWRKTHHYW